MQPPMGIAQRRLRRITVCWGPTAREHLALVPIFTPGYKVLGMVGLDAQPETEPVWYPGTPLTVERRRIVFKSSLSDAPPSWGEVEEGMLEHTYFHDPWGAIETLVPLSPDAPSLEGAVNLTGHRIQGLPIADVIFEPHLHRVRAIELRGRWGRTRTVPVLRMPALPQSLEMATVAPLDVRAFGAPPPRPEGRLSRLLRRFVEPLLNDEANRR